MKKIIIAVIILTLMPVGYLGAKDKDKDTVDPAKDKTVMSWKGRVIPPKYKYYFYKKGMTAESEDKDFTGCIMESLREPIGVGTYISKQGYTPLIGFKDPLYDFAKIYIHLGICMENRGYVIKEHSLNPEPDPDFPKDGER